MISYHCDNCGKSASTMVGWYVVRVALLYADPNYDPPGALTVEEQPPDYIFDTKGCQTQWLAAHDLGGKGPG